MTKDVLIRILELCKSAYPYEVNGVLLGKKIIDDFILTPSEYGHTHVITRLHEMPIYPSSSGSFHSHPSPNNRPSGADLRSFSRMGNTHLIVGYPYNINNIAVYDSSGKKKELEIV